MSEEKLGWKERFASIVVLLISVLLLALQVISIVSNRVDTISGNTTTLSINRAEFINYIRFTIFLLIALIAGALLFKQKKSGWMVGVPFLFLCTLIAGYFTWFTFELPIKNVRNIFMVIGFLVLFFSLMFLLLPSARQKYKVSKRTYLPTLVFLVAMCTLYFFLQ